MDKIYRRVTQSGGKPKKKKNEKNRVRNAIVNFHVSPTEKELIETRVALSGLSKADFFIESCMYQAILVKGNIKSFNEIKKRMTDIATAINDNPDISNLSPELMESFRMILEILDSFFGRAINNVKE